MVVQMINARPWFICHIKSKGDSAKVGRTCKVEQVVILHGNKSEQPVLCVVLHSIFVHFIVSKTFEVKTCPTIHVRPTFADSHLVVSNSFKDLFQPNQFYTNITCPSNVIYIINTHRSTYGKASNCQS